MRALALVLLLLLLFASCASATERPLMFDDIPTDTVGNQAFQNCWKAVGARLPADYVGRYCSCAAERIADAVSKQDLSELGRMVGTDPSLEQLKLRLRLKKISEYCDSVSR